jgi:hypothetical protein
VIKDLKRQWKKIWETPVYAALVMLNAALVILAMIVSTVFSITAIGEFSTKSPNVGAVVLFVWIPMHFVLIYQFGEYLVNRDGLEKMVVGRKDDLEIFCVALRIPAYIFGTLIRIIIAILGQSLLLGIAILVCTGAYSALKWLLEYLMELYSFTGSLF